VRRALLLNADYTPLHFIPDWRAVRLLMPDIHGKIRAEVIYDYTTGDPAIWEEAFTSPGATPGDPLREIRIPATLRLRKYVNKKWKAPRFRKHVLFNRDNWKCQYCGCKLNSNNIEIEHVLPSSRGGPTSWLNCVAACKPCNKRKANKTPEEAGMPLIKKPATPSALHFWDALKTDCWHSSWDTFIPRIE
jgi:5-methylcytosine-specific restriction endonuclease McrA